ncbi:hypothetical protein HMPREF0653_00728 [Prevotella disiens JCM 6334 = ATCC 29426]|uniref:Uncharacterized protein n=1 Tax=Prevotella disiens JCM 6334 = ATCC 29426 TaxID=1235811 RepID=A0ABN0NU39_9BACT|nr:hypothetical protein HMPREF0653_00728 [Prevotella disiens JCM 6334 = ATCC 29426]
MIPQIYRKRSKTANILKRIYVIYCQKQVFAIYELQNNGHNFRSFF